MVYPYRLSQLGSGDPATLRGEEGEGDVFIVLSTAPVPSMPGSATASRVAIARLDAMFQTWGGKALRARMIVCVKR